MSKTKKLWNALQKCINKIDDGGFSVDQMKDIFGVETVGTALNEMTVNEFLGKYEKYESTQLPEVGDIVRIDGYDGEYIVIYIKGECCTFLNCFGEVYYDVYIDSVTKTGRDQKDKLLKIFNSLSEF